MVKAKIYHQELGQYIGTKAFHAVPQGGGNDHITLKVNGELRIYTVQRRNWDFTQRKDRQASIVLSVVDVERAEDPINREQVSDTENQKGQSVEEAKERAKRKKGAKKSKKQRKREDDDYEADED